MKSMNRDGLLIFCFSLLLIFGQMASATVQGYDSKADFAAGPSMPTNVWRYQYASDSNLTGPYTDLPYWDSGSAAWRIQAAQPPYLYASSTGCHPGEPEDEICTFLAPAKGVYLMAGIVSCGSGNGVAFSLTKGNASGADTVLAGPGVSAGSQPWGVLRSAVIPYAASQAASLNQIHFRVNRNGDLSNDATETRYAVYRLGIDDVPEAYTSSFPSAFGTGKPVPSGNGFGQLGDKDSAGNPVWFYQTGMPGNSGSYILLPYWIESPAQYSFSNPGGPYGWAIAGSSFVHPGPTEAASTVVTYSSPFKPMKASISCTASTSGSLDGVLVRIYKNNTLLEGCTLDLPSTGSGTIGTNKVEMVAGDCFHVTVSLKANQNNDATTLNVTVTGIPEAVKGTVMIVR